MIALRLFAVVLLGFVAGVGAAARDCVPQISVQALPHQLVEHYELGIRDVTRINQTSSHALTRDGLGLGSTVTDYRVNARIRRDGRGCLELQLDVGYAAIRLYVARELTRNACAFEHVRQHELEHVAINRRWLDEAPARIRQRLAGEYAQLLSLDAEQRLKTVLQSALDELKSVQGRHDEFDSPEEYARNGSVCDGHIQRVLDRFRADAR